MHIDPQVLRSIVIVSALLVILSARFTKGTVRQTPEGETFGIKPLLAWTSGILLAFYIVFFAYLMRQTTDHKRATILGVVLLALVILRMVRMPGTITLGPLSITQKFWLIPSKEIPYADVMAIQSVQGGRMTRVMGNNRVNITHTANHCAAVEFQTAIAQRTGKLVTT